ncbi:hypothetical protein DFH06DRAFT_1145468 [Mycena polygramma]|nr:hypothetical protein DFH06DRAFT_1145468 [Mycena polygramma]
MPVTTGQLINLRGQGFCIDQNSQGGCQSWSQRELVRNHQAFCIPELAGVSYWSGYGPPAPGQRGTCGCKITWTTDAVRVFGGVLKTATLLQLKRNVMDGLFNLTTQRHLPAANDPSQVEMDPKILSFARGELVLEAGGPEPGFVKAGAEALGVLTAVLDVGVKLGKVKVGRRTDSEIDEDTLGGMKWIRGARQMDQSLDSVPRVPGLVEKIADAAKEQRRLRQRTI